MNQHFVHNAKKKSKGIQTEESSLAFLGSIIIKGKFGQRKRVVNKKNNGKMIA